MIAKFNKVHMVGAGGIGMSSMAEILNSKGFKVTGSDRAASDNTQRLESLGINIYIGHDASNVNDADVVVYSSAVNETNPEVKFALDNNIPVIKRAEMLAETMRMHRYGIGIAGTHGKTTTTSMVGLTLTEGDIDPTIIVGGRISSMGGTNARLGKGDYIVVEADEFDRTFLKLTPAIAAITTLEKEHLDTYKDLDDIKLAFLEFANKVPFYGFVVLCLDEPALQDIMPHINKRIITYGLTPQADVKAIDILFDGQNSEYTLVYKDVELGKIKLHVPGLHNIRNSLVAVTIAIELGIEFEVIQNALDSFSGVYRRFEVKYDKEIMIVDDYAHHPTETTATLTGIRSGWNRRLVAVFQPHLYTRTRDFYLEFGRSFLNSDIFICTDVYPAREEPIEGVSGQLIVEAAKKIGHKNAIYIPDKNDVPGYLKSIMAKGDIIVTMGAGDIWKYGEKLRELIELK
ncbi:MAG: UDP-N-acetylmuramate--L-alanine ligase [Ignavibacteriaceae bacterium]|nr:UDP-N-acetylmuramate--L-alanine ligase [Ignavibacteriaceae bacterium]